MVPCFGIGYKLEARRKLRNGRQSDVTFLDQTSLVWAVAKTPSRRKRVLFIHFCSESTTTKRLIKLDQEKVGDGIEIEGEPKRNEEKSRKWRHHRCNNMGQGRDIGAGVGGGGQRKKQTNNAIT